MLVEFSGWVSVRCIFRLDFDGSRVYEERVTLWQCADVDTAIERAEAEAEEYATIVDATYTGLAQAYSLSDAVESGAEVFSLMRISEMYTEQYLDRYFDTGTERQTIQEDTDPSQR